MIKSFYELPPEELHNFVHVGEESGGVCVSFIKRDGTEPYGNNILDITGKGIVMRIGFSYSFGVKLENDTSRARVFDSDGDILLSHKEWTKKYPCSDHYHTFLVDVQRVFVCDTCGQVLHEEPTGRS
ncbi:MAG: hypothetical protein IMF13_00550 [Proteobacteria bacterium]|nr:hypothetical protein [Pseudomonadota bacterium]